MEVSVELILLHNVQFYMLAGMFILGTITFLAGVFMLISGVWNRDLHNTLTQTHRLVQKGLAEELAGLVGNASSLFNAINDLVKTRNGIGITLIITGIVLMTIPCLFILAQTKP